MVLRDSQLLLPYTSPYLAEYPEAAKQKATGGLVFWTTDRESYIGVGYNKNVLPAADVPKNFDDLLKPALKGKMAISNDDVAARFVGAMIKSKGEGFVKKLKDQDVTVHGVNGPGFQRIDCIRRGANIVYALFTATLATRPTRARPWPGFPWISSPPSPAARLSSLTPNILMARCCWSIFFSVPKGRKC